MKLKIQYSLFSRLALMSLFSLPLAASYAGLFEDTITTQTPPEREFVATHDISLSEDLG